MYDVREIDQNLEAMEDVSPLTEAEKAKLDAIRKELGTQFLPLLLQLLPALHGGYFHQRHFRAGGLSESLWPGLTGPEQRYAAYGPKSGGLRRLRRM